MTADIGASAEALYGLPPEEFTVARDQRAAQARKAGDRDLAAAIKKLRRPTASAALANRLVRERRDQVAELLGLGAAMRDAQAHLAGEELRRLSQEGQQAVTALSREAVRLARDAGQTVSEVMGRELEQTLHAALADPAASDALRAGCLSTALRYSGFGLADTPAAGSAPIPLPPAPPARSGPPARPGPPAPDRRQRDIEAAEQAVREAEARLAGAQADAADHERQVQEARDQRDRLDEQIRQLNEELERRRADERAAASRMRDAERGLQGATRRVQTAAAGLAQAQAELDRRSS